jgi:transcriptional regulator with XRE-family HTH domain
MTSSDPRVQATVSRLHASMKTWGITISRLAAEAGVTRQYLWQIIHRRVHLSLDRARSIERILDRLVAERRRSSTFGERLRTARKSAGFTLKEAAAMIGYSWAGVERWEKDVCRPKPGVLWHLMSIYNTSRPEELVQVHSHDALPPAGVYALRAAASDADFRIPLQTRLRAYSPTSRRAAVPPHD